MTRSKRPFPDDRTSDERRQGLSDEEVKDLELAGGVEGGMQAGRSGPAPDEEQGSARGGRRGSAGDAKSVPQH
jgi:hypothetical protein